MTPPRPGCVLASDGGHHHGTPIPPCRHTVYLPAADTKDEEPPALADGRGRAKHPLALGGASPQRTVSQAYPKDRSHVAWKGESPAHRHPGPHTRAHPNQGGPVALTCRALSSRASHRRCDPPAATPSRDRWQHCQRSSSRLTGVALLLLLRVLVIAAGAEEPTTLPPTTTTTGGSGSDPTGYLAGSGSGFSGTGEVTTAEPTTSQPTTSAPTTLPPTTTDPFTGGSGSDPTGYLAGSGSGFSGTGEVTTAEPTTTTTAGPTTEVTTTIEPTTAIPSTTEPTTGIPTTAEPTTTIAAAQQTKHAVTLSGDWVQAIINGRTIVENAAASFVANALGISTAAVVIDSVAAGSLIVNYRVTTAIATSSINALVSAGPTAALATAYFQTTGTTITLSVTSTSTVVQQQNVKSCGGGCIALVMVGIVGIVALIAGVLTLVRKRAAKSTGQQVEAQQQPTLLAASNASSIRHEFEQYEMSPARHSV